MLDMNNESCSNKSCRKISPLSLDLFQNYATSLSYMLRHGTDSRFPEDSDSLRLYLLWKEALYLKLSKRMKNEQCTKAPTMPIESAIIEVLFFVF